MAVEGLCGLLDQGGVAQGHGRTRLRARSSENHTSVRKLAASFRKLQEENGVTETMWRVLQCNRG